MRGLRAGEAALLIAKQHGFEHVFRDRGAIHRYKGVARARRAAVDEPRQYFLACAGLTDDQHRAVARGHPPGNLDEALRAGRISNRLRLCAGRASSNGLFVDGVVCHLTSHICGYFVSREVQKACRVGFGRKA